MFDYFNGRLIEKTAHFAVIDIQGIGYKIFIPTRLLGTLPECGQTAFLYVSWVVREMSQTLYGFETKEERDLFEVLLNLSGIGPKTALAIIGHFELQALEAVVQQENFMALAKVPGIGKKTAERLIVDLRGRLQSTSFTTVSPSSRVQDALSALLNLGYSRMSAEMAIKKAAADVSESSDVSTLISAALKYQGSL